MKAISTYSNKQSRCLLIRDILIWVVAIKIQIYLGTYCKSTIGYRYLNMYIKCDDGAVKFRKIINKSLLKRYFCIFYIPQIVKAFIASNFVTHKLSMAITEVASIFYLYITTLWLQ